MFNIGDRVIVTDTYNNEGHRWVGITGTVIAICGLEDNPFEIQIKTDTPTFPRDVVANEVWFYKSQLRLTGPTEELWEL